MDMAKEMREIAEDLRDLADSIEGGTEEPLSILGSLYCIKIDVDNLNKQAEQNYRRRQPCADPSAS